MIEALRRRLPFARKDVRPLEPEKVPSGAFCISPEQLSQSNLRESTFDFYSIPIVDKQNGLAATLSIRKKQKVYGIPFYLPPDISSMSLVVQGKGMRRSTEQAIPELGETAERLRELACGEWVQSEASPYGASVTILVPPTVNGLLTQNDVGSFIKKLPELGFQYEPDAGRAYYNGDLTKAEVKNCNFPPQAKELYLSILNYLDPKFWGLDKSSY